MSNDRITYNVNNGVCRIKLDGKISYSTNGCFSSFITGMCAQADLCKTQFDLFDCTYLDSTNLGLIAAVSIASSAKKISVPEIYVGEGELYDSLVNVGFDKIFTIKLSRPPEFLPLLDIIESTFFVQETKRDEILKAHHTLSSLNDRNKETFKGVIDAFEAES